MSLGETSETDFFYFNRITEVAEGLIDHFQLRLGADLDIFLLK